MIRSCVFAALFGIFVLARKSGEGIKGEPSNSVGNQFLTMFELVILPLFVIAYLLSAGVYDLLVMCCQAGCIRGRD